MKFCQPLKLNYRNVFEFINVVVVVVSANREKKNFSIPRTSFCIYKKISFIAHRRQKHFDAIAAGNELEDKNGCGQYIIIYVCGM